MTTLKEQAYGQNWGSDAVGILYPSVSSCITLTYFYTAGPLLVGAHFGMENANHELLIGKQMDLMLQAMESEAPSRTRPARAFLIGAVGWWDAQRLGRLYDHVRATLGGLDNLTEWDIPDDYKSSDVEIYTCGVWSVRSNAVQKLHTGRFSTGRALAIAV